MQELTGVNRSGRCENMRMQPRYCHRTYCTILVADGQCHCSGNGSFQVTGERVGLRIWKVASDMPNKRLLTEGGKHWGRRSELKCYVRAE